jgi:hypothetical protein
MRDAECTQSAQPQVLPPSPSLGLGSWGHRELFFFFFFFFFSFFFVKTQSRSSGQQIVFPLSCPPDPGLTR